MGSKSIEWESQRAIGGNSWLQQLAAIVIPKLDNVVKVETVLSDHVEPEKAEREKEWLFPVCNNQQQNHGLMYKKRNLTPSQLCTRMKELLF